MTLTKKLYKQINDALLSSFPTRESLTHMLKFQLNKHLNSIVSGGNLQNMVFDLIQVAEAEGWIKDLVIGARKENPGNPNLLEIAEKLNLTHKNLHLNSSESLMTPATQISISRPVTILFLAANPQGTGRLALDQEVKEIDNALRRATFRNAFDLEQQWAVSVEDLQEYLLRYNPDIVHFSGHGSKTGELYFANNLGKAQAVRGENREIAFESMETELQPLEESALANLFELFKDTVKCVVLNACYSKMQANAISKHINCVVGMSRAISDSSAIAFAKSFYQGLGFGRDVETSFKLGKNQINLTNLAGEDIPQILGNYDFGVGAKNR